MPESPFKKYSVSMPEAVAEDVRTRVGKGAFSAYVTAAVQERIERERLAELVEEHIRHHGEIPEAARAQAAAEAEEAERRYAQWLAEQPQDDALAS
ncbi:Arc/MetJ-type ribon-helix-helix transcriptional regulator [Kitasatospora gansuensis]|uniref:Arc/MetJ-type ribon-helix-helix transcriptional regulator n=1 Tax=Kitasatospora gansuensis TaxID=258050 RepID=A0A7W7SAE6_9ACTN|nr:hypothetical protein [Kitasatospora gansuensis]MBB4945776.1 Arc/MetJ-type ribon-helix-helix transcriptional regulator [Kitasatospora gansuensis]